MNNSAPANELKTGDRIDALSIRWNRWTPREESYKVTAVRLDGDFVELDARGELWEDETIRVPADRRFDLATS